MTRRIALASLLVVALVVGLAGVGAYVRFAHDLRSDDDAQLAQLASRPLSLLLRPGSGELAELRSPAGAVVLRTPALSDLGTLPAIHHGYQTVSLAGRSLRVEGATLPGGRMLVVAIDRHTTTLALTRLRRVLWFGGLVAALTTAFALVLVTRRLLAPLREVTRVAETITRTGDLAHRVPPVAGSHEPAQLAASINAMLERLHASDEALRRMVADASHELRTPLTTLRGNVDLLGATPALADADRREALQDAAAEVARMQRLVEDMLDLAQSETLPVRALFDLRELVPGAPAGILLRGDRDALARVLENLRRNAESYGGGGAVAVAAGAREVSIRVVDHGAGVPVDQRDRLFDRFARGQAHQGVAGSGLGLAIARSVARAHGGDVAFEPTPGGGATFALTLPRASGETARE
jgi:two-component system sensor histidine kinase MprB